jgi:hypothetical protein
MNILEKRIEVDVLERLNKNNEVNILEELLQSKLVLNDMESELANGVNKEVSNEGEETVTHLVDSDGDVLQLIKFDDGKYMLRFKDVFFNGAFFLTQESVDELQMDFDAIHQYLPCELEGDDEL